MRQKARMADNLTNTRRGICGVLAIALLLALPVQARRLVEVSISRVDDTTHVEFRNENAWNFTVKESGMSQLTVITDPLSEQAEQQVLGLQDELVQSVQIDPMGPDGRHILNFQFASGATSYFHYYSNNPTKLMIDFFTDRKKLAEIQKAKARKKAGASKRSLSSVLSPDEIQKLAKNPGSAAEFKRGRRLRQDVQAGRLNFGNVAVGPSGLPELMTPDGPSRQTKQGIFDGGDPNFSRFNINRSEIDPTAIIRSKRNVYLRFPMLENKLKYLDMLHSSMPIYKIAPKDGEENRIARLLLDLFNKDREAVFTHTLKLFHEKYPNSRYREMALFMDADITYKAFLKGGAKDLFELAMDKYTLAMREFPASALGERIKLIKGFSLLDQRNSLGALAAFGDYLKEYPKSARKYEVELAIASASIHLRKYKEAKEIYDRISGLGEKFQRQVKEASYRKGDVEFHQRKYKKAVQSYQAAFNKYPDGWAPFPNAFFNSGEALFWMGEYKRSLDFFRDFLRRFPDNERAGYAMTRIGELLEIMGAPRDRVIGAYLETYFRYGNDPGADVAQVRLMSHKMKNMKEKELEKALTSMYEIGERSYLEGIRQFVTIKVADGLMNRGDYDGAIGSLDNFFKQNPTLAKKSQIASRIRENLKRKIDEQVSKGNFMQALRTYDEYKGGWLKGDHRIDIPMSIGRAYEMAGVYERAASFYRSSLERNQQARKKPMDFKIRREFEDIPTLSATYLRLSRVAMDQGDVSNAEKSLSKVEPSQLENPEKVERNLLQVAIAEKLGQDKKAIELLDSFVAKWENGQKLLMSTLLKRGQLKKKLSQTKEAEKDFTEVVKLGNEFPESDVNSHAQAMEELGTILLAQGKKEEAFNNWNRLLGKYEKSRPLASVRYKAGRILFEQGKIQDAVEYWESLEKEKNQFWHELAQEQLKNSRWRDDYKRYIKRIPAMAKDGRKK